MLAIPDSQVHGANKGPTWFLSAPEGPNVGPMNLAIRVCRDVNVFITSITTMSTLGNPFAHLGKNITPPFWYLSEKCSFWLI